MLLEGINILYLGLILSTISLILALLYIWNLHRIDRISSSETPQTLSYSLELINDAVSILKADTFEIVYMNEHALKSRGLQSQSYVGKTLHELIPLEAVKYFIEKIRPLIDGTQNKLTYIDMQRAEEVTVYLADQDGNARHIVRVAKNISDRIKFETVKDEFISTVSHELRSPVTSIKGALGLILSGAVGPLPEKATNMVSIAHRNADRLVLLINDILDIEKIAAGSMRFRIEPCDINTLLHDAVEESEPYAEKFGVKIELETHNKSVFVNCDADRTLQVMTNLLSNAAKFSKPKSKIIIMTSQTDEMLTVYVRDFGVGIPKEAQDTIFDRFSQADSSDRRAVGGSGLGLSIAKAIVERHDGTLSFESEVNKGTTFSFTLPLTQEILSDSAKAVTNELRGV
ncbi:hypothetical protein F9L33_10395 [Amylibacter sp. SFDW26]|uniref:sensor histidine kinase n=1 Tax=Amylibacter sp. SFDW26 TaxID=2652722 RepID=UPI001261F035|nr:PAS domain-containing sensor histidine kinase [Amylibacter sp. SFDW26]KAB7613772.1 hypothetical protein F9L33_10395 [Amylibacter sp. SFDW26]